jgi:hypothetical protein
MSAWMIALAGVLYLGTTLDFALKGQWWLALGYAGYALSNVGWVMVAISAGKGAS